MPACYVCGAEPHDPCKAANGDRSECPRGWLLPDLHIVVRKRSTHDSVEAAFATLNVGGDELRRIREFAATDRRHDFPPVIVDLHWPEHNRTIDSIAVVRHERDGGASVYAGTRDCATLSLEVAQQIAAASGDDWIIVTVPASVFHRGDDGQ